MLSIHDTHRQRTPISRRAILLVSWVLMLAMLMLLAAGILRPHVALTDIRRLFFAGLVAVELAGIYLFSMYNEQRKLVKQAREQNPR